MILQNMTGAILFFFTYTFSLSSYTSLKAKPKLCLSAVLRPVRFTDSDSISYLLRC